jgi:hypothetical protein
MAAGGANDAINLSMADKGWSEAAVKDGLGVCFTDF